MNTLPREKVANRAEITNSKFENYTQHPNGMK